MSYLLAIVACSGCTVFAADGLLLKTIILLEEIPQAFVAAHLNSSELVRVPEISKNGLDV